MSETSRVCNKKRKYQRVRTVNNGYIDIDSIKDAPGINYVEWIKITKDKLKEREIHLLSIKMNEIHRIVNITLCSHKNIKNESGLMTNNPHYNISNTLMKSIFHEFLFPAIDRWTGVHIDRIKKKINTFRDYFVIAKNWWDLSKKKLIGSQFWVTIFEDIKQVKLSDIICLKCFLRDLNHLIIFSLLSVIIQNPVSMT